MKSSIATFISRQSAPAVGVPELFVRAALTNFNEAVQLEPSDHFARLEDGYGAHHAMSPRSDSRLANEKLLPDSDIPHVRSRRVVALKNSFECAHSVLLTDYKEIYGAGKVRYCLATI